ncbi:MAG: hypothetical protein KDE26_27570, partial [Bacteroidetes bacterium]|nr:hypothetical protein [Bacteroidota bacterium]
MTARLFKSSKTYILLLVFLLTAGLYISCRQQKTVSSNTPPEENRFTTTVLSQPGELDEPMAFTFLDNSEMLIVERKGGVKAFN